MEVSNKILSDITVYMKYAKYIPELNRRETWDELVTRNKKMHQKKYPHLKEEIEQKYKLVYDKKVLPSMRSMQFGENQLKLALIEFTIVLISLLNISILLVKQCFYC